MKKTINIYSPDDKKPEADLELLADTPKGVKVVYYMMDGDWMTKEGLLLKTEDIFWWTDLEKLTTDMHIINLKKPI